MEDQQYYESLLAQGYGSAEAEKYTKEHYPQFSLTPVAPVPVANAQMPVQMSVQQNLNQPAPITQMVGVPNYGNQQVVFVAKDNSKTWKILNGVFGILFSLAIFAYSLFVKEMWSDFKVELETLKQDLPSSIYNDMDSIVSSFSLMYTIIMVLSICMLIVSIIQFTDKKWGTKAFLGMAGVLFLMLLFTGYYETTKVNELTDDVDAELSSEDKIGDISFFESNGALGSYCAGTCSVLFGIFALLGRPKGPPVELQM